MNWVVIFAGKVELNHLFRELVAWMKAEWEAAGIETVSTNIIRSYLIFVISTVVDITGH